MREPLADSIDPRRQLGIEAGKMDGIWPVEKCQRVLGTSERLLSDVTIEFALTEAGRYIKLDGCISADLELCCQRCLQPMVWKLKEPLRLILVPHDAADPGNDDYEALELDERDRIETAKWIEEEIILRIPNVPMHTRMQDCDPEIVKRTQEFDSNASSACVEKENPFNILKSWKDS